VRTLSTERHELIDALVAEADIGGVTASLLEKDEHLTAALQAVFELKFEYASLIFCGGTSLSKAHNLIERMSEDADIKVVLSQDIANWPKMQIRRYLGDEVRGSILKTLEDIGLQEDKKARLSQNENRYFHCQWTYRRTYEGIVALRPNLQLELTARSPVLPIHSATIGTLADKLASRTEHTFTVPVVSIAETLAEKVLSFLRRFAQHRSGYMQQDWDTALVRHIYDVHCIVANKPEVLADSVAAFSVLTETDVEEFGHQDPAFASNPKSVLNTALNQVKIDPQSRKEYQDVLLPLVYGQGKYSFDEAWSSFEDIASRLIASLASPR
jgi:predicted nucleotidyltransferase component of viral defense system